MAVVCSVAIPSLIWLIIPLMVLILVVVRMLLKIRPDNKLQGWLNIEEGQLVINIIIGVLTIALYNVVSLIAFQYLSTSQQFMPTFSASACRYDMLKEVNNILYFVLNQKLLPDFGEIVHIVHGFEVFNSYSAKLTSLGGLDIAQKLAAGFDVVLQPLTMFRDGMMLFITSMFFQIATIDAIRIVGYELLLPMSILLRFLPPTRRAANELLAIVLSFTVIMPLFYLLLLPPLNDVLTFMDEASLYSAASSHSGTFFSRTSNVLNSVSFFFLHYGIMLSVLVFALNEAISIAAYGLFIAVIVPSFIFTLSITFVKTISEVLSFQ
ncbi:MAG: hypothetical protein D6769_01485 [Methanobacteriota archaeon]|nr:MAG: hypothetical protein D6769_01485 [Euryarchaeota archaeon]